MKLVSPLLQGLNQPIDLKGPQTDFSCVAIKGSEMLLLVSDVIMSRADKKTHSQAKVFAQTVVSIEGFSLPFLALVLRSTAHV